MVRVATLGSHCSLQVLKGAKDEGLKTLLICERRREGLYKRFGFIDELILVDKFSEMLDAPCQSALQDAILIPHGTLIAQMSSEQIESIKIPMFGSKMTLKWESDRNLKERLMKEAGLRTPKKIARPEDIDSLVIVKRHGAAGGKGYFVATGYEDYMEKRNSMVSRGIINEDEDLYIQEYSPGVLAYLQFFYSPLKGELEFFGADQRHESDIEGLARIPSSVQIRYEKIPSFNVIGNTEIVLRESLLAGVYDMGEAFVKAAQRLAGGMNGPFCIEGVYDEDANFTAFEFSARIVAGTNIYMNGSPYYDLLYGESMSMGRRIAREIREADSAGRLKDVAS